MLVRSVDEVVNSVLGAPIGTVFSLECLECDAGMSVESYNQAVAEGWTKIEHDDGPAWNFLGLCPDCKEARDAQRSQS